MSNNNDLGERIQALTNNIRVALSPLDGNPVSEEFVATVLRDVLREVAILDCKRPVLMQETFEGEEMRALCPCGTCIVCIARKESSK